MIIKTAIALAIIASTASGALAVVEQSTRIPSWDEYDCTGVYVGPNPKILINRPQNGICDSAE